MRRRALAVAATLLGMTLVPLAVAWAQGTPNPPKAASRSPAAQFASTPCTPDALAGSLALPIDFPEPWERLRRDLLQGKCALLDGNPARAEAIFRQGLEQDKRLPNLWRYYVLRSQVQQGKAAEAMGTLAAVMADRRPGMQAHARQLFTDPNAGVPGSADEFDYLATYAVHAAPGAEDHDLLERLHALAQERKDDGLLRRLPVLLWRLPKDESTARRWAAALDKAQLSPADWVARQQRLTDLRLTKLVADELESSRVPALDAESGRRLGRLYFGALLRDRNYRQAAAQIQSAKVRAQFSFDQREYLTTAIRVEMRRRVIAPVVKWLEELEAAAPKNDALPGIYLDLARYYEQRKDPVPMRRWAARVVNEYPRSGSAPEAYWLLTWQAYEAKDWHQAVRWSSQAIENGETFNPDVQARFHYWKARCQEHLGEAEAAQRTRATLAERWPSTYYGLILDPQTRSAPTRPKYREPDHPAGSNPAPVLTRLWTVPELADAVFIRAVGEEELAESLLRIALVQQLPPDVVAELAGLFAYAQAHFLQQRLIANQAAGQHVRQPVEDSPFWRRAYPPAYWQLVNDEAGGHEVSPYFVLAIMREESRFHVKADSRAGAKGLMQLMPATAREVARQEKSVFADDALLTPELNIPLGVRYLRRVLHRFDWNPVYAAAAYNAGPGAVTKWTREWGNLPLDEFVENIPFEETQNYVRRVYASYLIYRKIYK